MTDFDIASTYQFILARCDAATSRCKANKQAIFDALKANSIPAVAVTYSGSGDSGCIDGVDPFQLPESMTVDLSKITVAILVRRSRLEGTDWKEDLVTETTSLNAAIEEFTYDWLQAEHPGWQNNDGADGEIVFDIKTGGATMSHNSFYVESETTEHTL